MLNSIDVLVLGLFTTVVHLLLRNRLSVWVGHRDVVGTGAKFRIRTDPTKLQSRGVDNLFNGSVPRFAQVMRHVFKLAEEAFYGVGVWVSDRLQS